MAVSQLSPFVLVLVLTFLAGVTAMLGSNREKERKKERKKERNKERKKDVVVRWSLASTVIVFKVEKGISVCCDALEEGCLI